MIRGATALAIAGALPGTLGGVASAKWLRAFLPGMDAGDPVLIAATYAFCISMAAIPASAPAHRASRIDSLLALKQDSL